MAPATRRAPVLLACLALVTGVLLAGCGGKAAGGPPLVPQTGKKAMWGPVRVDGRSAFPTYRALGVGIYQYAVNWDAVAPTRPAVPADPADPAYRWPADMDEAVVQAGRYGMQVAVRVSGTPGWANGGRARNVLPRDDADYTAFLAAIARRYPSIRIWQIWEEPNLARNLRLQPTGRFVGGRDVPDPGPLTRAQRREVEGYAELVDASFGALKGANPRNLVVGGDVTSCGTVGPERFMQGMRLPDGSPPRMDLFGINPYGPREPIRPTNEIFAGCADFPRLAEVHDWTRALSRDGRGLRLFLSEYSDATAANGLFNWHVTPAAQARRVAAALRVARSEPWIYTFGWYFLTDVPGPDGRPAPVGLIGPGGRPKPAYEAFRRG